MSDKAGYRNIYLSDDGTSLINKSNVSEKVRLTDCLAFLKKFKSVDLISINIEGEEYKNLNRLIEGGLIKRIKFLQIQFHDFVPAAKAKRSRIIKKILKSHTVRYSYPFVWESFEKKEKS